MTGIVAYVAGCLGRSLLFRRTWYWVAVAKNGEILATSETYSSAAKCDQTAKQVAAQLDAPYYPGA